MKTALLIFLMTMIVVAGHLPLLQRWRIGAQRRGSERARQQDIIWG